MSLRASMYRAGKDLRPYSVSLAAVEAQKLHVVEKSELQAIRQAEKLWRRENRPKVIRVEKLAA